MQSYTCFNIYSVLFCNFDFLFSFYLRLNPCLVLQVDFMCLEWLNWQIYVADFYYVAESFWFLFCRNNFCDNQWWTQHCGEFCSLGLVAKFSGKYSVLLTIILFSSGSAKRFWPGYKHNSWWISWTCLLHQGLFSFCK